MDRGFKINLNLSDFYNDSRRRQSLYINLDIYDKVEEVIARIRGIHKLQCFISLSVNNSTIPIYEDVRILRGDAEVKVNKSQPHNKNVAPRLVPNKCTFAVPRPVTQKFRPMTSQGHWNHRPPGNRQPAHKGVSHRITQFQNKLPAPSTQVAPRNLAQQVFKWNQERRRQMEEQKMQVDMIEDYQPMKQVVPSLPVTFQSSANHSQPRAIAPDHVKVSNEAKKRHKICTQSDVDDSDYDDDGDCKTRKYIENSRARSFQMELLSASVSELSLVEMDEESVPPETLPATTKLDSGFVSQQITDAVTLITPTTPVAGGDTAPWSATLNNVVSLTGAGGDAAPRGATLNNVVSLPVAGADAAPWGALMNNAGADTAAWGALINNVVSLTGAGGDAAPWGALINNVLSLPVAGADAAVLGVPLPATVDADVLSPLHDQQPSCSSASSGILQQVIDKYEATAEAELLEVNREDSSNVLPPVQEVATSDVTSSPGTELE